MRRFLVIGFTVFAVFSFGLTACEKEQQPVPKPQQQMPLGQAIPGQMPPGAQLPPGHGAPKGDMKIFVPDSVKGKWSAVKLVLEDKTAKQTQEIIVNLNSEFRVPNSNLKVAVGEFLPQFIVEKGTATSGSNLPNNPAVAVKIFEDKREIFKGWLYANFPTIQPFEHPKYGLTLKEGIKKA